MKLFSTFVLICIFSNIYAQDDDVTTRIHKRDSVTQLISENYLRNTLGTKFFNRNLKFEKNYGQGQEHGIRYNFMFGIGKGRGVCYDLDPTTGEIEIAHWITS